MTQESEAEVYLVKNIPFVKVGSVVTENGVDQCVVVAFDLDDEGEIDRSCIAIPNELFTLLMLRAVPLAMTNYDYDKLRVFTSKMMNTMFPEDEK